MNRRISLPSLASPLMRALFCACLLGAFGVYAHAQETALKPRLTVALVLEGGGALGLAHIGIIKVIEELGIPIDIVVGTSMGAIVGGFYAQGYDAAALEKVALNVDWTDILIEHVNSSEERYRSRVDRSQYFASIDFDKRGFIIPGSLLSGRKLLYFLDRSTISVAYPVHFDTLPRRYRAVAADLATGERVVIDRGSLADVMRASMGIPGVLAPHVIDGQYLVDGGMVDNLPISTARELGADLIIAVDMLGGTPFSPELFDRNPIDALIRTMNIMIRANVLQQLPGADLVLTIDLQGFQTTDFKDAVKIMSLGEETARSQISQLEAFKSKLELPAAKGMAISPIKLPAIQYVTIKGGNDKDQALAYSLFSPFIGTIPDETMLDKAIGTLEALGLYQYIRVNRIDEGLGPTLLIVLTRHEPPGHSLQLGIEFASTYSSTTESKLSLSPGIILRGLTTVGSRLAVNVQMLDSPSFEASFLQPIGLNFFTELAFDISNDSKFYIDDSIIDHTNDTNVIDIGINVGLNPVKWMELLFGFSYSWVSFEQLPSIVSGDEISSALMAHALFSVYRLNSPIFPTQGIGFRLSYDTSLPAASSERVFHVLSTEGIFVPKLNTPLSFTFWGRAATDFSAVADDSSAAPQNYKQDIRNRDFYPGPLEVQECVGSHIAGIGGVVKYQVQWASRLVGVPAFILSQIAAATVLQNFDDIDGIVDFTHWNVGVGVGARVNDGLGVSLRLGMVHGFDSELRPFLAFDIGSIGF